MTAQQVFTVYSYICLLPIFLHTKYDTYVNVHFFLKSYITTNSEKLQAMGVKQVFIC